MTIDHELALEFLRKAEHDLGSARLLLTGEMWRCFGGSRSCKCGAR